MHEHTITITTKSIQERNIRIRDLLSRGYMPIKFYERQTEYIGVTEQRYVDKNGKQQRTKAAELTSKYCVVMRKRVKQTV